MGNLNRPRIIYVVCGLSIIALVGLSWLALDIQSDAVYLSAPSPNGYRIRLERTARTVQQRQVEQIDLQVLDAAGVVEYNHPDFIMPPLPSVRAIADTIRWDSERRAFVLRVHGNERYVKFINDEWMVSISGPEQNGHLKEQDRP